MTSTEFEQELTSSVKNLKLEDLVRGDAIEDIEERCLKLCQDFLGDVWLQAKDPKDIFVERICGGLTNQLYLVRLALKDVSPSRGTPTEVTIKIYQSKHEIFVSQDENNNSENERMSDTIISLIASQVGFGPRLYGVFPDGVIQAYYKVNILVIEIINHILTHICRNEQHEQFRPKQQANNDLVDQLAVHLATMHNLQVPIVRPKINPHIQTTKEKVLKGYQMHDVPKLVAELGLKAFQKKDLKEEIADFERILTSVDSPTVLCHNDYRGSNLLVTEEGTKMVVCDYDYSGYGPRGFDFASLFHEWDKELFDFATTKVLPDEPLTRFVERYIETMKTLQPNYGDDPRNTVEVIKREAKTYQLANLLVFVCLMFCTTESMIKAFPYNEKEAMVSCID